MGTFRIIILVTFLFSGSFLYGQVSQERTDLDESYTVYSMVLKDFARNPKTSKEASLLVINSETEIFDDLSHLDTVLKNMNVSLTTKYKQPLDDYKVKNGKSEKLTKSLSIKQDYVFIGRDIFKKFFETERLGWDSFYTKYPNSSGFITLSRVGFDAKKQNALVWVEIQCGALCGSGNYILLSKTDQTWSVIKIITPWSS